MPKTILADLRSYWKAYQSTTLLFPGGRAGRHVTERSAQKVFARATAAAGIKKQVSVHILRHSFATHLMEGGNDMCYMQGLLDHRSSKTTEFYTHVMRKNSVRIESPLDTFLGQEGRSD